MYTSSVDLKVSHTGASTDARALVAQREALALMKLPDGWSVIVGATHAKLTGPNNEILHAPLEHHGEWLSESVVWRTLTWSEVTSSHDKAVELQIRVAEIERWLGFIEESAIYGHIYDRGVSACKFLNIVEFRHLHARLAAAHIVAVANASRGTRRVYA